MRIFITGATGFIGRALVQQLAGTTHELRCLVRPTSRTAGLEGPHVQFVPGDLTDRDSLAEGMRGCQWVVNLANLYEFWHRDRRAFDAVNVEGTRNLLEAARAEGVAKVVHVSTVAAYGDAPWPIDEETPWGPHTPGDYARTKRIGEDIARDFHARHGLPVVIIAPGGVMGAGDPKATSRLVRALALGTLPALVFANHPFPFVHVRDVAQAIARALEKPGNEGEKYILAAGNPTFGEIARTVSDISGTKLPRWTMPGPATVAAAYLATAVARLTGKPPAMDLAVEQVLMMRRGMWVDGSKAARELGIAYTPVRTAVEEEVREIQGTAGRLGHLAQ
jgi:dihydroflavonol-4-reductase